MADPTRKEFGSRRPSLPPSPVQAPKRSHHVALLLMGTMAVGSGAYALMPPQNCQPNQPGMAATPGQPAGCASRGTSSSGSGHGWSGGSSSRSSFFSGESSSSSSSSGSSPSSSNAGHISRGGFGTFASGFASHFSGGG